MRRWRGISKKMFMTTKMKNEMRMYLLVATSLLMRIAQCSASGTTLMIGAPGPCGSCSLTSSWSNLIQGSGMSRRWLFQGVHPVTFSISPLTNLPNCAQRAGSSSGFLMGPVMNLTFGWFGKVTLAGIEPATFWLHNSWHTEWIHF